MYPAYLLKSLQPWLSSPSLRAVGLSDGSCIPALAHNTGSAVPQLWLPEPAHRNCCLSWSSRVSTVCLYSSVPSQRTSLRVQNDITICRQYIQTHIHTYNNHVLQCTSLENASTSRPKEPRKPVTPSHTQPTQCINASIRLPIHPCISHNT